MNYDLSKLKPDGSHYLVIGFSLPYCLHVPDGNYRVKIVSQDELITTQIIFEKKKRTLSKRTLLPGTKEIEKFADRKGSFNYTTALVYIPVKVDSCDLYSDFRLMNEFVQAKHSWYREQAIDATNRFISVYRYCTGECHVRLLAGHDVWFDFSAAFLFNENAPNAKRSSFKGTVTPHFNIHDIIPLVPDIPDNVLHEIRNRLISTDKIPIAEELMLNAYDLLDQGNYRLAVIEAETAFEAAILKFLRDEYQSQDITLKKSKTQHPSVNC